MNSRERVQKAINHEEADRVPIDIGGTVATGIHSNAYIELGRKLGLDVAPPIVYDPYQLLARIGDEIRAWFHSDVIQLELYHEFFDLENRDWKIWENNQGNRVLMPHNFNPKRDERGYLYLFDKAGGKVAEMAPTSHYFDKYVDPGYKTPDIRMTPEEWKKSIPKFEDAELRLLEKRAKLLHENTDYSICGSYRKLRMGTMTGVFAGFLFEDWLCTLYTDPDYIYEMLEATAEQNIENLELYFEAVEPYIDIVFLSTTDYGTQRSELFNPETFRKIYLPNIEYSHPKRPPFALNTASVRIEYGH